MSSAYVVFIYVNKKEMSDTSLVVNFIWNEPAYIYQKYVQSNFVSFEAFIVSLLPSATVVAERQCFHKCMSRILSTGGGVFQHAVGQTPPSLGRHPPPWADTPLPGQTPPSLDRHPPPWTDTPCPVHAGIHPLLAQCMLVRILLECIRVKFFS